MPYPANTRSPFALLVRVTPMTANSVSSFSSFLPPSGSTSVRAVGGIGSGSIFTANGWKYEPSFIAGFSPAFWKFAATYSAALSIPLVSIPRPSHSGLARKKRSFCMRSRMGSSNGFWAGERFASANKAANATAAASGRDVLDMRGSLLRERRGEGEMQLLCGGGATSGKGQRSGQSSSALWAPFEENSKTARTGASNGVSEM